MHCLIFLSKAKAAHQLADQFEKDGEIDGAQGANAALRGDVERANRLDLVAE